MCGINGIYNYNKNSTSNFHLIHKMNNLIAHRGPDDSGIFQDNNCTLGHRRLSIIDLSKEGHQPFHSDDSRFVIVYNGEIYNYLELRNELEIKGIKFKTKTDTEVLLKAFIEWGIESLHKLNGMFAFAIYDNQSNDLYLIRDRFGVKPIYYFEKDDKFFFSSELLPLLKTYEKSFTPNDQIIYDYIVYNRTNHTNETFFKNIYKLPHGHYLIINKNGKSISKWYDLKKNIKSTINDDTELLNCLTSSINLRLRSDVPIGTSLSGGIDSSSIVSIMVKELNQKNVNTFSSVYKTNHKANEKKEIDSLQSSDLKMEFIYPDGEEFFKNIDKFVSIMNEPVPSTSVYASYSVYEKAKNYVTVMLDGQGADESLAGYGYFRGYYYKDLLKKLDFYKLFKELFFELFALKSLEGIKSLIFFIIPPKLKEILVRKVSYLGKKLLTINSSQGITNSLWNAKSLEDAKIAHFEYKLEHLLTWGDKTSMANSIEVRYPFLDYRFVERAIGIPGEKLFNKGFNKVILRNAMKGLVPNKILNKRIKIGFETPEDEWFRTPIFQTFILKLLNSKSFSERGYIDSKVAQRMYQKHLEKSINISGEIWKWIHLELWFREFID